MEKDEDIGAKEVSDSLKSAKKNIEMAQSKQRKTRRWLILQAQCSCAQERFLKAK